MRKDLKKKKKHSERKVYLLERNSISWEEIKKRFSISTF